MVAGWKSRQSRIHAYGQLHLIPYNNFASMKSQKATVKIQTNGF